MKGGRIRESDGINPFKYYEVEPKKINFDKFLQNGENIYVLAHQPGIGKTYNVMEYLKEKIRNDENFTFFYFTDRHKAIEEHTSNWDPNWFMHWEGFSRICPRDNMKKLYEKYNLSPVDICNHCHRCNDYLDQFEENRRVFAPFNYLFTHYFRDNPPDIVFLDESIRQLTTYSIDIKKAEKAFQAMGMDELAKKVRNKEFHEFLQKELRDDIKDAYEDSVLNAFGDDDKEKLKALGDFNPYNFFHYLKWDSIYKFNMPSYGVPTFYYSAFDAVVNRIPIVIMDATFNPYLFSYFLESYNGETSALGEDGFSDLNVTVFKTIHENKGTVIYRMRPTEHMPKSSFIGKKSYWERSKKWLKEHMSLIKKTFGTHRVGIITYEEYADICEGFGFDVEHFGSLRGTNILEDKPVLVIVGTYSPPLTFWDSKKLNVEYERDEYFEDLIRKYFLIDLSEDDIPTVGYGAPEDVEDNYRYRLARRKGYSDKLANPSKISSPGDMVDANPIMALNTIWYDEMYQAFHRNRGLLYDKIIFAYCWFPEPSAIVLTTKKRGRRIVVTDERIGRLEFFPHNVREEFTIDKISDESSIGFFYGLREIEKRGLIEKIIDYIEDHPNANSDEIVDEFHVYKKGEKRGRDTIPITMLKKILPILYEEAKYPDE